VTTAFADQVRRIYTDGGLSEDLIAQATGAAPSTVRDWFARRRAPTGTPAERVGELSAIVERLPRVMHAEYIPAWLANPNEALDQEKPIDVIARGEYTRVARLVSELEDPGAT
jgi:hypothetical protein